MKGCALERILEFVHQECVVGLADIGKGLRIDGLGPLETTANALESGLDGAGGVIGELSVVASIAEHGGPGGVGFHGKLDVFIEESVDGGI